LLLRGKFMTVEPDGLEVRGEASGTRVGELRDFRRATMAGFNALRTEMNERFADMSERFVAIDRRFRSADERFDQVDNGFIEMRGKLDAAAAGQQQIVDILQRLIANQG
jgi:hypothetical protein